MEYLRRVFGYPSTGTRPEPEPGPGVCARFNKMCTDSGDYIREVFGCPKQSQVSPLSDPIRKENWTRFTSIFTECGNSLGRALGCPWSWKRQEPTGGGDRSESFCTRFGNALGCPWKWPTFDGTALTTCGTVVWEFPGKCFRKVRSWEWPKWEPNQNGLLVRTIKASKLDGFKAALKPGLHILTRTLFFVSYTVFACLGAYLIWLSYLKFIGNPILYKYSGRVSLTDLPFPSTSICPPQLFLEEKLQEANKMYVKAVENGYATDSENNRWSKEELEELIYYLKQLCQSGNSFARRYHAMKTGKKKDRNFPTNGNSTFNDSPDGNVYANKILPFVSKGMMDIKSSIIACLFGEEDCSKYGEWETVGPCYTFNAYPQSLLRRDKTNRLNTANLTGTQKEWEKYKPDTHIFVKGTQGSPGTQSAYAVDQRPLRQKIIGSANGLSLLLRFKKRARTCKINGGNAYMVELHSPFDEPQVLSNGIFITPEFETNINVNVEVTIPGVGLQSLSQKVRGCTLESENFLDYFARYTENNCKHECLAKLIQKKCSCNTLFTTDGNKDKMCGRHNEECVNGVLAEIENGGYDGMCATLDPPMVCYPPCTEPIFSTDVSSTAYFDMDEFLEQFKIPDDETTGMGNIYYGSDTAEAKERHQQYDMWEVIGIVGGILGLTNGFDFMTIIYIFVALVTLICGLFFTVKVLPAAIASSTATQTDDENTPAPIRNQLFQFKNDDELNEIVIIHPRRSSQDSEVPMVREAWHY